MRARWGMLRPACGDVRPAPTHGARPPRTEARTRCRTVLDSEMPPRRRSLDHRRSVWSLLALASCSWGCPQLLSDEFKALGNPPDRDDPGSPHIDGGSDGATAGSAGDSGSEPPPDPLNAGGTGG